MLYFIEKIRAQVVVCADEHGEKTLFPRAQFPAEIQADMPVIRRKDGGFFPYEGPFLDEDGLWWQLVYNQKDFHLENRRAPLTNDEIKRFLAKLAEEDDKRLLPALNLIISDLLQDGRTELAQLLIIRAEMLAQKT